MDPQSRWQEIRKTSPSGKTLFVCLSCGRQSPVQEKTCPPLKDQNTMAGTIVVPCGYWPMSQTEYVEGMMDREGFEAYFMGTVFLPMGPIDIRAPIPKEVAEQIAVIAVCYQFAEQPKPRMISGLDQLKASLQAETEWEKRQSQLSGKIGAATTPPSLLDFIGKYKSQL